MGISKFNQEGYPDPTAYQALCEIHAEEREIHTYRPLVYICSPYSGDVERNTDDARRYCRFAVDAGYIPIAPHLFFPQFMNDGIWRERELAMFMNIVLLSKCSEVWVFGKEISPGMQSEIDFSESRQKKIRYFTGDCKEVNIND